MNRKNTIWGILAFSVGLASCEKGGDDYDASGVFETTEVIVSARGSGEIMRFDLEEGDQLEAGETVGSIDTVQLHLKKKELLGNLLATDSRRYDVGRQIASLRQEIATQRREQQRYENLVRVEAANQKQLDDINSGLAVLEKRLAAQIETLENGNRSVSGQVLMLEAQIGQIEDQMEKCLITSPVEGVVLSKYAEPGEWTTQGRSLFKVGDLERMYLRVYVTAPQLTMLQVGQPVKVYADEGEKGRREYAGTVSWISDQAEFTPKTIQTREERANLVYAVKVSVRNDGYIKRGMYGEIKLNEE